MYKCIFFVALFCGCKNAIAHPMPSTMVNLFIWEKKIKGEAQIPVLDLEAVLGKKLDFKQLNNALLTLYFLKHINASTEKKSWKTTISNITVAETKDSIVGIYKELIVYFELQPPATENIRKFTFNYNAIIHQIITHKIFVYVQQDWFNGIQELNQLQQIGVIELDVSSEKYNRLEINLEEGSWWKGFKGMLHLGMQHIKEGIDHLLFLFVLLLPAMLFIENKKWGNFNGLKFSLYKLLTIVTAFTIGHSVTLLLGALQWVQLPQQPVEFLIAFSIFISAIHAIKPIFYGKELYIAASFGLVHGLAFATVLSSLHLTAKTLFVSILGFNIGIEMMQLFIVVLIFPWILLLSKTPFYKWFKNGIALLSMIAALAWMIERISGNANIISPLLNNFLTHSIYFVFILALVSIFVFLFYKFWWSKKVIST